MSKELRLITYNNERILTTELLARIYECNERNISDNFNNHSDKFTRGKHYYLLQGDELREFKREYDNIGVAKNVNKLYLWTERGANRHCKILDTDKAWEQFDNLEETYFRNKEYGWQPPKLERGSESLDTVNRTMELVIDQLNKVSVSEESKVLVMKTLLKKAGVDLPIDVQSKEKFYDSLQIARELGVYSGSGKPHGQAVKTIIDRLELDETEQKQVWETNGSWQGTVIKYTNTVVSKVKDWLIENNYPEKITVKIANNKTKNFTVVYKDAA
jgi:hypothetical protein